MTCPVSIQPPARAWPINPALRRKSTLDDAKVTKSRAGLPQLKRHDRDPGLDYIRETDDRFRGHRTAKCGAPVLCDERSLAV